MALLNDILKWTETLPSWQRDAARHLLLEVERGSANAGQRNGNLENDV